MEVVLIIVLRVFIATIAVCLSTALLAMLCFFPYPTTIVIPDAYLVLGCAPKKDGSISNMMKSRVDEAISQYHFRKRPILFTGWANRHPHSEARVMADYAISKGIPKHHILLEEQARSTYENFKYSLPLLRQHNLVSVCVVTNHFHMRRAGFFARKFHLEHMVAAASLQGYLPSAEIMGLSAAEYFLRLKCLYYEWKLSKS